MKQFGKILGFELKNYLVNKVFLGVTIFLVAAIAIVMFFPRIAGVFGRSGEGADTASGEEASGADLPVMLIAGAEEGQAETVRQAFAAAFGDYQVRSADAGLEELQEQIVSGQAECAFVLSGLTGYTYYVDDLSMYDANTQVADEVLQSLYRLSALTQAGIPAEQAQSILSAQIAHETVPLGKDQMSNFFYTYIMIFALYMVILLYGQMVATNVATEKSSRAMEVLITSAKPVSMMFGKVIASCLAGLIQLICVFGSAFLCFNLNRTYWDAGGIISSLFDMPLELLLYMLLFFVLGFFIYAFLFGAVGSTASKLEDINTSVMPITLLFIVAFIVVVYSLSSSSVDNLLLRVCAYIPFTSPMAMFTRIAMSTVPWYEIVISVAILIASVVGVGVLSAKIYRVGVLLYGTPPKPGAILRAIRKA